MYACFNPLGLSHQVMMTMMMMKAWVRKTQERAEQILGKDVPASSACQQQPLLHGNILTPHNIPEFFLPPRLVRQTPNPSLPCTLTPTEVHSDPARSQSAAVQLCGEMKVNGYAEDNRWLGRKQPPQTQQQKGLRRPAHLSVESPARLYESPHTRRKESLFHSSSSRLRLEQQPTHTHTPGTPPPSQPSSSHTRRMLPPRSLTRSCPSLCGKSPLLQTVTIGDSGSESAPSTPPPAAAGAASSPTEPSSTPQDTPPTTHRHRHHPRPRPHHRSPSPSHLAPPLPFPLELLHCQERLHREHLLLLPTRGRLRLATERPGSNSSSSNSLSSPTHHHHHQQPPILLRVRVVSVEGVRDPCSTGGGGGGGSTAGGANANTSVDLRPFSCSLSLCLMPGKLQQQHSATIRHCREPIVFNEDFYFSQPEPGGLSHMQLQIKVKDKSGGLGRVSVLGVISKPLAELMAL
ncbi:C2 calcium-dependent domain-containing protein 4D [Engraulis encrasicolus]|uniref:C2 calcium-dependent domain-containing protein 4D n=1 Tax=Engraulis encrasicolus TaxID=184585 RepID=UPI002FD2FDFE